MLIDTHCHLNDRKAFPDPGIAIQAALDADVRLMMVVGTHPDDWASALELAEQYEPVYAILGWHPNYTADYTTKSLTDLRAKLQHPKVVALGEIGLDYHWDYAPRDKQFEVLHAQLDLAEELNLPVVFHAREAYADLLDVLEKRPVRPYLMHCFAGSIPEAQRAVAIGCLFGVDGPITYKKADDLREMIRTLPHDQVVLETDAPYLSPTPYRGKPNQPSYVQHTAQALADLWGVNAESCHSITTSNALRIFGLTLP